MFHQNIIKVNEKPKKRFRIYSSGFLFLKIIFKVIGTQHVSVDATKRNESRETTE